jgi:hypothetical protein
VIVPGIIFSLANHKVFETLSREREREREIRER